MRKISISFGGSTLAEDGVFDVKYARELGDVLAEAKDTQFVVSTGGGKPARDAIRLLMDEKSNKFEIDELAIAITRVNAAMLKIALGGNAKLAADIYPGLPTSPIDARLAGLRSRIIVQGGYFSGVTTDTCAVLAAEAMGAKTVINISNTSHIYDKDPAKHGDAKKLSRMSYDELIRLASGSDNREPGTNFVFDLFASKIIKRSGIKAIFIGRDMGNLRRLLKDERKAVGTVVSASKDA